MIFPLLILLSSVCIGCSSSEGRDSAFIEEQISSRHEERPTVYKAHIPVNWKREDPEKGVSLEDTMLPVVTFWTPLRLTFYTFPFQEEEEQIPHEAQVQRWSNQFGTNKRFEKTVSQAFGGFVGSRYEAIGEVDGKKMHLLAWSMQLPSRHIRTLKKRSDSLSRQSLSSWTIKVMGDPDQLKEQRQEIIRFARSIHLIYPL